MTSFLRWSMQTKWYGKSRKAVTPAFHWNKKHWSDVYYDHAGILSQLIGISPSIAESASHISSKDCCG